jgi:neurotransmitter:Na+ symporter, NSS family
VGGIIIEKKEHWNSRLAFIMAAIGSAIGLGNVWRFPYICYANGGGAFLLPFFIALFTAGISLLILEFTIGHWSQKPPPAAFKEMKKKWEWAGWWASFIPFLVSIYYVVIMAWCFAYMIYAIDLRWGVNSEHFFLHTFLGVTNGPLEFGDISIPVILGLIAIWTMIFIILYKGVDRIGKVVLLTVPIPTILLMILTIRGITLPGAMEGISYYLTPDFSALTNVNVWLAAYAQVFFSIGVAQGIMITYASYLKKTSDINNNAIITALADAGTSFFAGFTVFSVIGYLAASQGVSIDQLGIAGPFLVFVTYPTAISLLPAAAAFFGILFYIALLTFGIDSAFSMIEPLTAGINHRFKVTKTKTTATLCIAGFSLSLLFTAGNGLYLLELMDHFVANFGLVAVGLVECILIGWFGPLQYFQTYTNKTSEVHIGKWWNILIKFIIPLVLILLLTLSIIENIINPYMGYPWFVLLIIGAIPLIAIIFLAFILMKKSQKEAH